MPTRLRLRVASNPLARGWIIWPILLLVLGGCAPSAFHSDPQPTATATLAPMPTATPRPPSVKEVAVHEAVTGIAVTPDGRVWYGHGSAISSLSPAGAPGPSVTLGGPVFNVVLGPDHRPWAVARDSEGWMLARVAPNGTVQSFHVPNGYQIDPDQVVAGPDGAMWYLAHGLFLFDAKGHGTASSVIGRITPAGDSSQYSIPQANYLGLDFFLRASGAIAAGPDRRIWILLTHMSCVSGSAGVNCQDDASRVAAVSMSGTVQTYAVPGLAITAGAAIIAGPDGNLWMSTAPNPAIISIAPAGRMKVYPLPAGSPAAASLAFGPDGALWFTTTDGTAIGRMTIQGATQGTVTEHPAPKRALHGELPQDVEQPDAIIAGPGGALWFTERAYAYIGHIAPGETAVSEVALPDTTYPTSVQGAIVAGADGTLWYSRTLFNASAYPMGGGVGLITP